jgi:hypothetical protein
VSLTITIEPTDSTPILDGVRTRLWHGMDEDGIPYLVFVHRIATDDVAGQRRLAEHLVEMPEPTNYGALKE